MKELIEAMQTAALASAMVVDVVSRRIAPVLKQLERTNADLAQWADRLTSALEEDWSRDMSNSSPFINRKGFSPDSIAPDLHAEFSSKGGRAAAERGTLHKFSPGEAAKGGSAGGRARAAMPGAMSEMGRAGGVASGLARRRRRAEREAAERKKQGGDDNAL